MAGGLEHSLGQRFRQWKGSGTEGGSAAAATSAAGLLLYPRGHLHWAPSVFPTAAASDTVKILIFHLWLFCISWALMRLTALVGCLDLLHGGSA